MPIDIKEYQNIKQRKTKSNKELIEFMEFGKEYTTTDIKGFLQINKNATLQRLRNLEKDGYLESRKNRRVYLWKKVKDEESTY